MWTLCLLPDCLWLPRTYTAVLRHGCSAVFQAWQEVYLGYSLSRTNDTREGLAELIENLPRNATYVADDVRASARGFSSYSILGRDFVVHVSMRRARPTRASCSSLDFVCLKSIFS